MRRLTRTKIVSTVGPSSSSEERLAQLFEAGVDVFRLNFSHGTHDEHAERFRDHPSTSRRRYRRPIGILADMQGPKLRVGSFADGRVELQAGAAFRLDLRDEPGDLTRVTLPHPEIFEALKPGLDAAARRRQAAARGDRLRRRTSPTPRCWSPARSPTTRASICPTSASISRR